MKENKKLLKLNWAHMPILKRLVLLQICIALAFSLIVTSIAIYIINEKAVSAVNSRKLDILRLMTSNQEKVRLWAKLEMDEALISSLKDIKKITSVEDVKVLNLSNKEFNDIKKERFKLVIPEVVDDKLPYYFVFDLDGVSRPILNAIFIIPVIVFIFVFILLYSSIYFIYRRVFRPLSEMISYDMKPNTSKNLLDIEATGEIKLILEKIKDAQQEKIQIESEKSTIKLSTQLAHDIRSPLEALKSLREEMGVLPETSRKRVQLSINRIEEITFNLLKNYKESSIKDELKSEELLSLITSILTEKEIEYRSKENVQILENITSLAYGLFSKVHRGQFKSILSNLINNSIESFCGNPGVVNISIFSIDNKNIIQVTDNGPGIPESIRGSIFTNGFTTKKNGNGLGLYNAKQEIEAIGGTIMFESRVGEGTTFTISLPESEVTPLFVRSIDAYKYDRIIILDDDPAFHEVWNKRLEGLESKIEHIYSVKEMFAKYQGLHPKILLLSDFELMDEDLDGIDTILKLQHAPNSVLVTARSEEAAIQERCLKNGIKLLPKALVNYVKVVTDISDSPSSSELPNLAHIVPALEASKFDQVEGTQGGEGKAYGQYVALAESRSSAAQDGQNQKPLSESSQAQLDPAGMVEVGVGFIADSDSAPGAFNFAASPTEAKLEQVAGTQGAKGEAYSQSSANSDDSEKLKSVFVAGVQGLRSEADRKMSSLVTPGAFKFAHVEGRQEGGGEAYDAGYVADHESSSPDTQDAQNQKLPIVLIDDDMLVRINWSSYCQKKGLPFLGFKSVDEFLAKSSEFSQETKIYVDSNLGNGTFGEVESEKIFALGFHNLFLATGYQKDTIRKPRWIKEIYSKSPECIS